MISIRPIKEKDIPTMMAITDDSVIECLSSFVYFSQKGKSKESIFEEMVRRHSQGWFCSYTILDDEKIIGCAYSFTGELAPEMYRLGYWISEGQRRNGVAEEALGQLMDRIKKEDAASTSRIRSVFVEAVSIGKDSQSITSNISGESYSLQQLMEAHPA